MLTTKITFLKILPMSYKFFFAQDISLTYRCIGTHQWEGGGASYVINAYLLIIIVIFYTKVLHFRFCTGGSCSRNWFKQVFIIIILSFTLNGVADEKVFMTRISVASFILFALRAETKALIGGCIFIYSRSAQRISFEINGNDN